MGAYSSYSVHKQDARTCRWLRVRARPFHPTPIRSSVLQNRPSPISSQHAERWQAFDFLSSMRSTLHSLDVAIICRTCTAVTLIKKRHIPEVQNTPYAGPPIVHHHNTSQHLPAIQELSIPSTSYLSNKAIRKPHRSFARHLSSFGRLKRMPSFPFLVSHVGVNRKVQVISSLVKIQQSKVVTI